MMQLIVGSIFTNGPEIGVQSLFELYQTQKTVLDTSLLNTQHYMEHIMGKGKQSSY